MRKELEGRPLLGILAALIAGLTGPSFPLNLLLVVLAFVVWLKLETRLWITAALLAGVLFAPHPTGPAETRRGSMTVVVCSVPRIYEDSISFEAETSSTRLLARIEGNPMVCLGDRLWVTGRIAPRQLEDRFLESKGLQGRLYVGSFRVESHGLAIYRWADGWRRSFLSFALQGLPESTAHIVSALCFNTDSLLDDDTRDSLRRTGTIHIVSVSGMHIFVFAFSMLWALSRIPVPRWAQLLVLAVALSFYAITVGLNAPVVRAVIMSLVGSVAYLFGREKDWLSALALAGILNLLWQPRAVFDMGFQLSFVTVAAFIICLQRQRDSEPSFLASKLRGAVVAGFVASAFSAPLVAYHFGEIPLLGIVTNLLVAAPVSVIVVVSLVAHGVWFVIPSVGIFLLDWIAGSLAGFVDRVIGVMSQPSWAAITIPEFPGYALAIIYPLLLLATWRPIVRQP